MGKTKTTSRAKKEKVEQAPQKEASISPSAPWLRKGCPKEERPTWAQHLSQSLFDRWIVYLEEEQKPLLASKGVDPNLDLEVFIRTWLTGGKGMNEARTYAKLKVSHPAPKEEEPAAAE